MSDPLMNERAVAEYLGVKVGTLRQWRWQGIGPQFLKIGSKVVRYDQADVRAWVESHKTRGPNA